MPLTVTALRPEAVAQRLQELGIATAEQLEAAKRELLTSNERFGAILARQGVLRDPDAGRRLAAQLGALPQSCDRPATPPLLASQLPLALWRTHRLAPLREEGEVLILVTDDPLSVFALDLIARQTGRRPELIVVREQDVEAILASLTAVPAAPRPAAPQPSAPRPADPPAVRAVPAAPPPRPEAPPPVRPAAPAQRPAPVAQPSATSDEPVIQLVDSLLAEAVRLRASDVHLQAGPQDLRIRYRIDGVLQDASSPPKALQGPLVSRIKIMAGMNIAEKRLPQDGRLQMTVEGRALDVRVSMLPAAHGEAVVMRLLDRSQPVRGLLEMGLRREDQEVWEQLIHRPHGMVLVTGPTGAGKTTTLYGALALLNKPDRKLITVEDPVEYQLSGVNQVAVKSSIGLSFAAGLRAMLRQAPDVIMVGEIRDQETAQIAIQAALTGHLVLSTLHTNDAPGAITRLVDMGVPPFLVASTLQAVLAQRLVRRVCPGCRGQRPATDAERRFLGAPEVTELAHGAGCDDCRQSGFKGRVGIFELLVISEPVRHLVVAKAGSSAIREAAMRGGMRSLREDGCAKIREGLTTMEEVLRVAAGSDA